MPAMTVASWRLLQEAIDVTVIMQAMMHVAFAAIRSTMTACWSDSSSAGNMLAFLIYHPWFSFNL